MDPTFPFTQRMLLVGFGSVGRGSLPLLLRHFALRPDQVSVIAANDDGADVARGLGVAFEVLPLAPGNFERELTRRLGPGDFLLNASVDVASTDLIGWCLAQGVHYVDAGLEPWDGAQADTTVPAALRTHYAYREQALALRQRHPQAATCVMTHGANPGMVSHFVKRAIEHLCTDAGIPVPAEPGRAGWARLAQRLGIRTIHVAERDGQTTDRVRAAGEFFNTWSCTALCYEALQPAELGWGTHEEALPPDGHRFGFGSDAAIYLDTPGLRTRVRSWAPHHGPFEGWLISHNEAISIADYLTVHDNGRAIYRPTCHYAYHPCDAAAQSLRDLEARGGQLPARRHVLRDDITGGIDELGVLLMGADGGAYWYGSQLGVHEARRLAPHNTATTLQVNASYVAAVAWALRHPRRGLVEPEEMDHDFVIDFAAPYLGRLVGVRTDWTPLAGRANLPQPDAPADPWQFRHFRSR